MDPIPLLKTVHVLSAIVLFGVGMGTAFHGLMSSLSRDVRAIAVATRNVVLADWLFTTPAVIAQPVTGVWLAHLEGWPLTEGWILASFALYAVAGACWLPVVWLQYRMRSLAAEAVSAGGAMPARYYVFFQAWWMLGVPAFSAMVTVVALMVFKPEIVFPGL
jgi:uncharacterized membrane protein